MRTRPASRLSVSVRAATALLLILTACGGGGGGGGGGSSDPLEAGLQKLGVDTQRTPRETAPGLALEPATSPLGNRPVLARTDELLLVNIGTAASPRATSPLLLLELTDGNGNATQGVLHERTPAQMPFLPASSQIGGDQGLMRTAVAADLDGNGLEEMVFVYQAGIETRVRRVREEAAAFGESDVQLAANADVTNIAAIAADLDLDGRDELVVGLTGGGSGRVTAWRFDEQGFQQLGGEVTIAPTLTATRLWLQLACGNVDTDARPELGVAVQEVLLNGNGGTGTARSLVLDDVQNGFAVLRDEAFVGPDQNQATRVGFTASIAFGDVDGDGLDEVLLAGLTQFASTNQSTKVYCQALDDRQQQFTALGGYYRELSYSNSSASGNSLLIRTVHLNALDIDGDGVDEVYANELGFQDFASAQGPWVEDPALTLDENVVWYRPTVFLDRTTSSFVVGNFDGDDREDLAVYRQDDYEGASGGVPAQRGVRVFGMPETAMAVTELRRVQCEAVTGGTIGYPILLPVNVDSDSPVLDYSEADYKLVFSEPIVLAALAAPPTRDGIGQNVAGSFTAFGNTTTTQSESERSVTFSAGVSVGVNLDGGALTQSEFELKATLSVAATRTQGRAYELSKTILFTSAPREDLVVFTTVPVDQYTYTILSHPDPQLVGQRVVVNYPRSPITLQAERGFYNASIPDGAQRIDEAVFQHTAGDATTYPTVARKNALRTLYGGLQIGPQAVGQGAGSTEVTLQVGSSISSGGALATGFQLDVEATAGGVLAGVSVGVEQTDTWRITSGSSTTYTGVVGAIDAANFAQNGYSFGLFTYVYDAPTSRQQFQVLNYWVE